MLRYPCILASRGKDPARPAASHRFEASLRNTSRRRRQGARQQNQNIDCTGRNGKAALAPCLANRPVISTFFQRELFVPGFGRLDLFGGENHNPIPTLSFGAVEGFIGRLQ